MNVWGGNFWLGSGNSNNANNVWNVNSDGNMGSGGLFYSYGVSDNVKRRVRPVVSLNSTLLSNATGSGTSADPYVIQ